MMKSDNIRHQIVEYTKQEMIRQGITHLTMDAIAQGISMSKRTLYQLFPAKASLVQICLADFSEERKQILKGGKKTKTFTVNTLFELAGEYLIMIHSLGKVLLCDLVDNTDYQLFVKQEEAFWQQQFANELHRCRAFGFLLSDVSPDCFAKDLLISLYENCLRGVPYATQRLFCRTLLRGIFLADRMLIIDACMKNTPLYLSSDSSIRACWDNFK